MYHKVYLISLYPPTINRGDRGSTPSNVSLNEGEESSFTDVTSEAASSRDVSSLSLSKLKTEVCDAATQHEMNTSETTTQTDGFFETSFMNRFDLTALLKNMKILVSDNNIKTGNYTEIYLRNKFLSSFILSFQKTPPEKSLEDNMSRRVTTSVHPARQATPSQLSKPTKPSSLPRPVGHRLKCLHSPLKTVGGNRRYCQASPQAFRGIKKQIFKPF